MGKRQHYAGIVLVLLFAGLLSIYSDFLAIVAAVGGVAWAIYDYHYRSPKQA